MSKTASYIEFREKHKNECKYGILWSIGIFEMHMLG